MANCFLSLACLSFFVCFCFSDLEGASVPSAMDLGWSHALQWHVSREP